MKDETRKLDRLVRKLSGTGKLAAQWPLRGGVSADVTAIEVVDSRGLRERFVIRRHGERDRRRDNEIAVHEFQLLALLHNAGIPVPRPRLVDSEGVFFDLPCIVVDYVEGGHEITAEAEDEAMLVMAQQLVQIHAIAIGRGFEWLADSTAPPAMRPHLSDPLPNEITAALEYSGARATPNPQALLHGDFWPGNVLWRERRLAAVLDWEDANIGDPLSDVANTRLELLWAFGESAMHRFTERYRQLTTIDFSALAYWDLVTVAYVWGRLANWGLEAQEAARMRDALNDFAQAALNKVRPSVQSSFKV